MLETKSFISRSSGSTVKERVRGLGILNLEGTHSELVDRVYCALKERHKLEKDQQHN